jgi:MFS family permease
VNEETSRQPLSWRALFALLLAMFAITVGYGIVLPILPFLIERLAGTAGATTLSWHTGLLTGIYILAIFLFAPLWGKVSDRWGRRPVILLGLTGFAATVALFALVESLPLLYLGRFLDGAFAAAIAAVAYALVGDHAPSKEWRAHRFALINIAGTTGFFVGPLLGGLVLRAFRELFAVTHERAFSAPFLATSGLVLLAVLMISTLVPGTAQRAGGQLPTPEKRYDGTVMLRLWIIAFVTALAIGAFEVGLSLRGKLVLGMDASRIGMLFAECSLVMFVVQALVFSPLIKPGTTRLFLAPGLATLAIGLVVVPFSSSTNATSIAVALVAASAGILSPIVTYWVSLGAGETQGADLGRVTAAASLGQAIGSAGGGLLFDVSILSNAAFNVAAIAVLAGLTASFGLPRLLAQHHGAGGLATVAEGGQYPPLLASLPRRPPEPADLHTNTAEIMVSATPRVARNRRYPTSGNGNRGRVPNSNSAICEQLLAQRRQASAHACISPMRSQLWAQSSQNSAHSRQTRL